MLHPNGIEDTIEIGETAQREFDALNAYLATLAPRPASVDEATRDRLVRALNEDVEIARWRLRLHHPQKLIAVASFREQVAQLPWCIAVRVTHVSSVSIEFSLATTNGVTDTDLNQILRDLVSNLDCGTTVDVISLTTDWSP